MPTGDKTKERGYRATSVPPAHLNALDGFRGGLALWVFVGHVTAYVGYSIPLVSTTNYPVDLFMLLSGFLMYYTNAHRLTPIRLRGVFAFYIARFFRIVPAFLALTLLSLVLISPICEADLFIRGYFPPPWTAVAEHFVPTIQWKLGNGNELAYHLSFLSGLVPAHIDTSPLPDWSLSLEMQFYVVLPILLVLMRKQMAVPLLVLSTGLAFLCPHLLGIYREAGIYAHFSQPSALPFKLNVFLAGMIVAELSRNGFGFAPSLRQVLLLVVATFSMLPAGKTPALFFLLFAALAARPIPYLTAFLGGPIPSYLGRISYSVYLCHLLVMLPIVAFLCRFETFLMLPPALRFLASLTVSLPFVLLTASLLYRTLEAPFISVGKRLSSGLASRTEPGRS